MPISATPVPGIVTDRDIQQYDHYLRGWTPVPFLADHNIISDEEQAEWEEAQQQQAAAEARFLSRTGMTRQEALARISSDYDALPKWW